MNKKTECLCECDDLSCDKRIWLTDSEAAEIYGLEDWATGPWIIANDCPARAGPGFSLLEQRDGYALYKELAEEQA